MIATCTSAQIRIWNPDRPNVKLSTEIKNGHNGSFSGGPGGTASSVDKIAFCPNMENVLASAGNDSGVRLWDVRMPGAAGVGSARKGTQVADCKLGDAGLSMVWHPDGREIAVATKDDHVKVLDVRRVTDYSAGAVASWAMECEDRTPFSPKKRLHGIAFSNSGRELFVTTGEGPVRILDYPSLEQLHTLSGHSDATYSVAPSPLGTYIAVGGVDSIISLWDTNSWHCSHMLADHASAVRDISFSFDGTFLTAGSMGDAKDGSKGMQIYCVETGDVAYTVETANPITMSAWHPLRYWVAFAGDPGGLKVLGAGTSL
jgi:THO complex subunit 3